MRLKKGDTILIISGKDKGKHGKILKVLPRERKIVVEGLNLLVHHIRPKKQREKGEKTRLPAPLDVSNAMLLCPHCGKPTRVGHKIEGKTKTRICKKCKQSI